MDVVDIALLNIIQAFLHSFDGAAEIFDIEHHAQKVIFLIPLRVRFSFPVHGTERTVPLLIKAMDRFTKLRVHGVVIIKLHIKPAKLVLVFLHPPVKDLVCSLFGGLPGLFYLFVSTLCFRFFCAHIRPPFVKSRF